MRLFGASWLLLFLLLSCAPKNSASLRSQAYDLAGIEAKPSDTAAETIAGISKKRLERFDSFIEQEQKAKRIPSAVFLLKRRGQVVQHKAYGPKSHEDASPMSRDEIFYIQSMTKPIISVAFMMLFEQGYFALSDPVSKYLPEFANLEVAGSPDAQAELVTSNSDITIAQVLTHTAGFSHGLGQNDLEKKYFHTLYQQQHETIEDRVKALAKLPLVEQPGQKWYYSASPDILALLIEKFSGISCADFLQKHLFDPLSMEDTGYNLNLENEHRKAYLFGTDDNDKMTANSNQTPAEGHTIYGGTHGLFSTATDYMKFCEMLLHGGTMNGKTYLSRKTVELMTSNFLTSEQSSGLGHGFGLGFGINLKPAESKNIGSAGTFYWGGAFNTYFFIDPKEEMIAILMMQFWPYTDYYAQKLRQLTYQSIID